MVVKVFRVFAGTAAARWMKAKFEFHACVFQISLAIRQQVESFLSLKPSKAVEETRRLYVKRATPGAGCGTHQ